MEEETFSKENTLPIGYPIVAGTYYWITYCFIFLCGILNRTIKIDSIWLELIHVPNLKVWIWISLYFYFKPPNLKICISLYFYFNWPRSDEWIRLLDAWTNNWIYLYFKRWNLSSTHWRMDYSLNPAFAAAEVCGFVYLYLLHQNK